MYVCMYGDWGGRANEVATHFELKPNFGGQTNLVWDNVCRGKRVGCGIDTCY